MTTVTDSQTVPITVGISFSTSDPNIITVQQDPNDQTKATVTAVAPGTASVTVAYTITVGVPT